MTMDIKKMWIIKCLTPYQEDITCLTATKLAEDKIHLRSKQFGQKTPAATAPMPQIHHHPIFVLQYVKLTQFYQHFNFLAGDFEAAFVRIVVVCLKLCDVWDPGMVDGNIVQLQVIAEITYCWFPQLDNNYADMAATAPVLTSTIHSICTVHVMNCWLIMFQKMMYLLHAPPKDVLINQNLSN